MPHKAARKRDTLFVPYFVILASGIRFTSALVPCNSLVKNGPIRSHSRCFMSVDNEFYRVEKEGFIEKSGKWIAKAAATAAVAASLTFSNAAFAENELSAKYGGGFDSSLVDQNCLVNQCSLQATACLKDDPSCRKGLTCTAKCLGDNACITGCMARYGNKNLDNLLKCTIEDNECIKIAILDGGSDKFGEEPRSIAPTIKNFNLNTLEGTWFKVVGFNPNYDCYACQRNSFQVPESSGMFAPKNDRLQMDVEFSMYHLLPDGSPPPPKNARETILKDLSGNLVGSQSIGLNDYSTHETMVFDSVQSGPKFVSNPGTDHEVSYSRTAHSEGEMFGLKFWENWYVIGQNDAGAEEFKFVYYNGKTRQNTYEGAFVYSRTKELSDVSMAKVYQIAQDAGMNPEQFCKINNLCFKDETKEDMGTASNPFRGFLASTKVSQLLGVEPVAARDVVRAAATRTSPVLTPIPEKTERAWWHEVGDYLENPHRHFQLMDKLRTTVDWPEDVKSKQ